MSNTIDKKNTTVEAYIKSFPDNVQKILLHVRQVLHEAVPHADEQISYGIPALRVEARSVVYFSGWKDHIAIYPRPQHTSKELETKLAPHVTGKGTLRFDIEEPIPYELIKKVAKALYKESRLS